MGVGWSFDLECGSAGSLGDHCSQIRGRVLGVPSECCRRTEFAVSQSIEEHAGARIARIRKQRGLTQQGLAMRAHLSKSLLSKVECRQKPASPTLGRRLCPCTWCFHIRSAGTAIRRRVATRVASREVVYGFDLIRGFAPALG